MEQKEKKDISQHHQQAAGCVVTKADIPYVLASVTCCLIFIVYGAAAASLGAALPTLAKHYNKPISQMGATFTSRGIGYLFGTVVSGWTLSYASLPYSKEFMVAISEIVMGFAIFLVDKTTNFGLCLFLFVIQGVSYGIIDTLANCAMPEMWGRRVQPWMQTMHSCFGIGAIIGPSIVGGFGYQLCFTLIFLGSFLPLCSVIVTNLLGYGNPKVKKSTTEEESEEVDEVEGRNAPFLFKVIVSLFFFIYVGAETGYAGWIPTYSIVKGITDSSSAAAYLSAIFWAALTVGRLVAIPAGIFFSATFMIRVQLACAVLAGILCVTCLTSSYSIAAFVSGWSGFALAAIFPVMMTIFGDYGYQLDTLSTTMFMIGATLGESIIPVFIGVLMSFFGPFMMPVAIFFSVMVLLGLYLLFHFLSLRDQGHADFEKLDSNSAHPTASLVNKSDDHTYNPLASPGSFTIEAEDDDEEDVDDIEMVRFEIVESNDENQ